MFIMPELTLCISFKIIEAPFDTQFSTFSESGLKKFSPASMDNEDLYLIFH